MLITLAADLSKSSAHRTLALSTHRALKSIPDNDVQFVKIGDQLPYLTELKLPSIPLSEIKNAVIIAFREIPSYITIDRTNTLIYLATQPVLDSYMSFMIHRVDSIIATNYRTAYKLCSAVQQLGLSTPVYRVIPWIDTDNAKLGSPTNKLRVVIKGNTENIRNIPVTEDVEITLLGEENVAGWNTAKSIADWASYDLYCCLDGDDMSVRKAMMYGVVPAVRDRSPYTEFIVNNENGYFVYNPSDVLNIIQKLRSVPELEAMKAGASKYAHNQMSKSTWAKYLIATVKGFGAENIHEPDLFASNLQSTYRRWIVPKIVLEAGQTTQIPRIYSQNRFKMVELSTIEEILLFFSSQRFMDVYIFDWQYIEYNAGNYNKIMSMVRGIGKRGINIFWCTDKPVKREWAELFKSMTILPVSEGLKRVRPTSTR